ncbi:uncharacterized protein LOC117329797 [Pecten maximus]|uniref:uncharacterized protein LOC117329797 n=1 Tax=Pecten maximus TaxID=6579 RepID=UPI0014586DF8|nr:uncharacterized protein LOC117329797 [Pecten maximus]
MAAIRNMTERRKRWNLYACACMVITVAAAVIYCLTRTVTAWERSSSSQEQHATTFLSEVANKFGWLFSRQNEQAPNSKSFSSHLLQVIKEDIHVAYIFLVTCVCPLVPRETTSRVAGIILLGFILFTCVMSRKLSNRNHQTTVDTRTQSQAIIQRKSTMSAHQQTSESDHQRSGIYGWIGNLTGRKIFWILVTFAFLGSLPWEFVRLYQIEVAKKMANLQVGVPDECTPSQISLLQTFRNWLFSILSWQPNPCEKYYKMLMVDPLWEVSPIMVISSAVTRCIIYPMELFFESVGRSLGLLFNEIPLHWQPLMFAAIVILLIIIIIVLGGYRLHVPFLFKMEPKTPVIVNKNVVVYNQSPNKNSTDTPKIKQGRRGGRNKLSVRNVQQQDATDGKKNKLNENAVSKRTNKTKQNLAKGDN